MNKPTQPEMRIAALRQFALDAGLSVHQREQEVADVQRRILALQLHRGVDPVVLAAAVAEQSARTQLAAQANRNTTMAQVIAIDAETQRQ